ncbi:polysaccharide deacetylase family protein [Calothrix sp. NIES-2100]|uniref:polysaccharide deacetylase family protein n=1 Tax=Calothrix sp. NIES-2100 TaxID=1954172 RepID=UPI0030DD3F29
MTNILLVSYITAPRIPLLGFHGIVDLNHPNFGIIQNPIAQKMSYPMQDLENFLEYLARNNYWFLSTQDLYDYFIERHRDIPQEYVGKKPIMLSFDDSYKTVYTNIIPVLERLEQEFNQKIKIVLFVNPGTLSKSGHPSTTYLSCEDLRTGFAKGFYDIQSHGQNHKNLVKITVSELNEELAQAQIKLRECMAGLAPPEEIARHIAYPYGSMNQQVETHAANYYQSGYLYNSTILRFRWLQDKYRISRLTVNRAKSPERLIQMATRSFTISK